METKILVVPVGGSQFVGARKPIWQNPGQEKGFYRTPTTDKQNWDSTKKDNKWKIKQSNSDMEQYGKGSMHLKKNKMSESKEEKKWILLSDKSLFHKQCLEMIETGVVVFRVGGSQFVDPRYPNWQNPRKENVLQRTPITDKQNRDSTKKTTKGKSNSHIPIRNNLEKAPYI